MDATGATELIVREIRERISLVEEAIFSGIPYDEYRALCGERKGLLLALGYTKDLKNKLESDDDD